jgi:hypothetical protein
MNVNERLSRRAFVGRGLAAGVLTLVGAIVVTRADDQPAPVDPAEPVAKNLEYTTTSPKSDQKCTGCALYQGKDGDPHGPCLLFLKRPVAAGGWCKGWVKKP